jgi:hypothetical protein
MAGISNQLGGTASKVSGTNFTITTGSPITAGDKVIIAFSCDNATATTPTIVGISTIGGVAPTLIKSLSQGASATAGSGTMLYVWEVIPTSDVTSGFNINITLSIAVTAKAGAAVSFFDVGSLADSVDAFASGGILAIASGANPAAANQLLIAIAAGESSSAPASDSDTSSGEAWSPVSANFTTGGSAVTNMALAYSYKVATVDAAYQYDIDLNADAVGTVLVYNTITTGFFPRGTTFVNQKNTVAYGNGLFVSGTSGGTIYTSSDGNTWTAQTNPGTASAVNKVVWNGTRFFAVKTDGTMQTSTNGTTWSAATAPSGNRAYALGYGNGLWVASDSAGNIWTAPDSASPTWTFQTNPLSSGARIYRGYAYGAGLHVLMGELGDMVTSPDGITWTARTSSFGTSIVSDVYFDGTTFVAVGSNGKIATSTNGTTWTQVTTTNVASNNTIQGITKGPSGWIAVAQAGVAVQSTNLTAWNIVKVGTSGGTLYSAAASGTATVISGNEWYTKTLSATQIVASDTLSASATESAGSVTVTGLGISASDTVSASVTDTSTISSVRLSVSDTLSASVTEGRSFGTVAVTASDALSASVTDVGAMAPVPTVASDTLSASVTETASISVVLVASDATTAAITEKVVITGNSPSVSNTLDGGTNGTTVTSANSGGASGDAFQLTSVPAGGTLAYDNTLAFSSPNSIKMATGGTVGSAYVGWTTALPQTETQMYFGAMMYFTALPTTNINVVRAVNTGIASSVAAFEIVITTAGNYRVLGANGATIMTSSDVIPLNTWFRVEGFLDTNTRAYEVRYWASAGSTGAPTNSSSGTSSIIGSTGWYINDVRYGFARTSAINIGPFWMDNLGASRSGWIGPGVVPVAASDTLSASVSDTSSVLPSSLQISANDTLSAAVTETSGLTVLSLVTASDTLSASVTGVATFATVSVTASDTLSASVTETVTKAFDSSDTLSASVTESSGVVMGGTATVSASDTLSASLTESTTIGFVAMASDTLSVTVDELSEVFTAMPPVPSVTSTALFNFDSDTQGFVSVLASNATSTWDQSNGNPLPALKITRSGKNNVASQSYWELVTTWQALGVALGSVITDVHLESAWNRVSTFTNGTGVQVGPYDIRNAAGALIGTLWSGRAASATDAGTAITVQPGFTPAGADALSNATVRIRLYNTIGTTGTANPVVAINDDEILLSITYTPPIELDEHFDDAVVSVTETANIVVVGQAISASDTLSASVTDTTVSKNITGITFTASDTLSASVTDTSVRQITFVAVSATDTLSAADTEISMVGVTLAGSSDTLSASVAETSKVRMPGGLFPAYDSDVDYNDVAEYNGGGQIQKAGSDTLTATVTESMSFGTINIPASDTLSVNVNDVVAITASRTTTDTLSAAVTESTVTTAGNTAADTLIASITETTSFSTTAVNTTDTLSASVTSTISFATIQISAADALTAMLTEATGGTKFFSTADTLAAMATESTQRLVNGNVIITSGDSLNVAVTETTSFATIPITANDTLAASVTGTALPKASFSASDTLTTVLTETSRAGVQRLASDTLSVSVTSTTAITPSSKYQAIVFDENNNQIATIPMLWTGTVFIELEQYLWTGSDWV